MNVRIPIIIDVSDYHTFVKQDNSIKTTGANRIAEALSVNSSLTVLNLGGNNLGDSGVSNLCYALKSNSSLTQLGLFSTTQTKEKNPLFCYDIIFVPENEIRDVGAQSIGDMLKSNSSLTHLVLSC